ncbi:NUDIX domain-containing protein [Paenarthrobacter nitroguajacolicus]|uniref:NUDIX domain-containing protein n=1 Tax=Paenarthrobacter nitroguajacolicus TaxID=211146 RepID=UPI000B001FE3
MQDSVGPTEESSGIPATREVVAVVLTCRGRIGLFKRSALVGSDVGRWHCITGYVDGRDGALSQAVTELREETGLEFAEISSILTGRIIELEDQSGDPWRVHTFLISTNTRRLRLNWEHADYRWVSPLRLPRFDGQVSWLSDVLDVFQHDIADFRRNKEPRVIGSSL